MIRDKFPGISLAGIPLSLFLKYYNLVRDKSENVDPFYVNSYVLGVDLKREPYYVVGDINSLAYGLLISSSDYRYPAKALDKHMLFMREIYEGILSKSTVYDIYSRLAMASASTRKCDNDFFLTYDNRSDSYDIISLLPYYESEISFIATLDEYDAQAEGTRTLYEDSDAPNITFNVYNNKYLLTRLVEKKKNLSEFAQVIDGKLMVRDKNSIPQIVSKISGVGEKKVYHADQITNFNLADLPEIRLSLIGIDEGRDNGRRYRILQQHIPDNVDFTIASRDNHIPLKYKITKQIMVGLDLLDIRCVAVYSPQANIDDDAWMTRYRLSIDESGYVDVKLIANKFTTSNTTPETHPYYIEIELDEETYEKIIYFPINYNAYLAIGLNANVNRLYLLAVRIYRDVNDEDRVYASILVAMDTISYSGDTSILTNQYSLPACGGVLLDKDTSKDNIFKLLIPKGITEYVDDWDRLEFHYGYVYRFDNRLLYVSPFDSNFTLLSADGISDDYENEQTCYYLNIYTIDALDDVFTPRYPRFVEAFIDSSYDDAPILAYYENLNLPTNMTSREASHEIINIGDNVEIFAQVVDGSKVETLNLYGDPPDLSTFEPLSEYAGTLFCEDLCEIQDIANFFGPTVIDGVEGYGLLLERVSKTSLKEAKFISTIREKGTGILLTDYKVFTKEDIIYITNPLNNRINISNKPFYGLEPGKTLDTIEDIKKYFKNNAKYISFRGNVDKLRLTERYNARMTESINQFMNDVMNSKLGLILAGDISDSVLSNKHDVMAAYANSFLKVISKSLGTFGDTWGRSPGKKKSNMSSNKVFLSKVEKPEDSYENIYSNLLFRNSMNEYMSKDPTYADDRDLITRLDLANIYPTAYKYALEQRARTISDKIRDLAAGVGILESDTAKEKPIFIKNNTNTQSQTYSRPLSYYKYCNFDRIILPMSILGMSESLLEELQMMSSLRYIVTNDKSEQLSLHKYIPTLSSNSKAKKNLTSYLNTTAKDITNNNVVQYRKETNTEKKIVTAQSGYGTILEYIDDILNAGRAEGSVDGTINNFTWKEVL